MNDDCLAVNFREATEAMKYPLGVLITNQHTSVAHADNADVAFG